MTAIPFPDFTVVSPGGRVRVEICSPDNAEGPDSGDADNSNRRFFGGFQINFVYRAFDQETGALLWERRQTENEMSPATAWVRDDGLCIAALKHAFNAGLLVIEKNGETLWDINLGNTAFASREVGDETLEHPDYHWTSAGTFWFDKSFGYFHESFWICRLPSGRRLVVDLNSGNCSCRESNLDDDWSEVERRESARRLGQLTAMRDWSSRRNWDDQDDEDEELRIAEYRLYDELMASIVVAGQVRSRASVGELRRLEQSQYLGGYTSLHFAEPSCDVATLPIRAMARLSLLRLGYQPSGLAPYLFSEGDEFSMDQLLKIPENVSNRLERTNQLTIGTSSREVLMSIGSPDAICRDTWCYDFLAEGVTVNLEVDCNTGLLTRIEPAQPGWLMIGERESTCF